MGGRGTRAGQAALGAALALALAACLPSIADRVAEARAKLIGLKARELNRCVGVPASVDEDGETEFLTYRWVAQEESDPFDPRVMRPTPDETGTRGPDPLGGDRPGDGRGVPGTPPRRDRPPFGVAYCELVFELRGGRVQSVEVEARSASGLNDDVDCISKAERCVKS